MANFVETGWPITYYGDTVRKFGYNDTVGNSYETVWDGSNVYPYPSAAAATTIVSDDVADTAAGTGARTVRVFGLDSNYNPIDETATLTGTDAVTLSNQYLRVFRAFVVTAGSGGANAGKVQVKHGAVVLAQITETYNQTLMATYTIAAGRTAYVVEWYVSVGKGVDATAQLVTRSAGGVFRVRDLREIHQETMAREYPLPLKLEEKTDVEVRALSSVANSNVAAGFDLFLL
jgi:hypothetical protein